MNRTTSWTGMMVASLILGTAACSNSSAATAPPSSTVLPSAAPSHDVSVSLNQWSVTPSTTPASGSVTFTVSNDGTVPHEFVVLKTNTPAADIPVGEFEGESERIDEDTAGTNVGETGDMEPGATKSITIHLAPGHYVFFCNLPAHYQEGMHIDVTVT